jgi:NAD(P)-dependent dehydrogenase (short-subunit alcohol dehydrogenase family)
MDPAAHHLTANAVERALMRLGAKVAIVTGAGSGIGRATALLFAQEGAAVTVADRDVAGGRETVATIERLGLSASFVETDVADPELVRSLCDGVAERFGRIDVLVNNAATFVLRSIEATPEEWRESLDVNVVGTALCTKYAAQHMKRRQHGSIVNLGSTSSVLAQPQQMTYNASKGAILTMTKCMAMDLAPFGIRVNCLCPGYVLTEQLRKDIQQKGLVEEEALAAWASRHLLKRLADPREVAHGILFLASDDASFVTGTALFVDGGYTAQ